MDAVQDYDSYTDDRLLDVARKRFSRWITLCEARASTSFRTADAPNYRLWSAGADSAKSAQHKMEVRALLAGYGGLPKDVFRAEMLAAIRRLDALLQAHA